MLHPASLQARKSALHRDEARLARLKDLLDEAVMTMTNKSLDYYLTLPYTIELTPDEDGYWFAEIPLLPGCMTQGQNRAEALEMIDEAKLL